MKKKLYCFDFDGTLTTSDTLLEFIKYAKGKGRFLMVFLMYSPLLVLMKLHLYPNWKAKQRYSPTSSPVCASRNLMRSAVVLPKRISICSVPKVLLWYMKHWLQGQKYSLSAPASTTGYALSLRSAI